MKDNEMFGDDKFSVEFYEPVKFKIHFTINDIEGSCIVDGCSLDDVSRNNQKEMERRGLDVDINNCWSEQIE